MNMKCMYGDKAEILSSDQDCTVYRLTAPSEDSIITAYTVFPGIELVYLDIHTAYCPVRQISADSILEISHCREGRMEYEANSSYFYIEPGDISITHRHTEKSALLFPNGHYHGISVIIDLEHTPECLSCFLADVNVSPRTLDEKFCSGRTCFIARSSSGTEHVFSELYNVPEELKRGYFKVKVLELMLFLTAMDTCADETAARSCSHSHALLAKEICGYLTGHISYKITLEQLSTVFHVSATSIKNSFKAVYGVSVYAYIRTQKMRMAAQMLLQSDDTVMEIAGRFGYDNASKFSGAFRDVIGMTPNEYRIHNSHNRI